MQININRALTGITSGLMLLGVMTDAWGQPAKSDKAAFEMTPADIAGLVTPPPTGQVIGGKEVTDPKHWPATLVFTNAKTGGGCTATIIGERVVLTAAHCVDNSARGRVTYASKQIELVCDHHPDYRPTGPYKVEDKSPDFALCEASAPLARPSSGYEVINTDPNLVGKGGRVVLLGYGCLTPGGHDRHFGALYQGVATVENLPSGNNLFIRAKANGPGEAAVCYGDSGGGAFVNAETGPLRWLVAVNARGDINSLSLLSATDTASFRNWADEWASAPGSWSQPQQPAKPRNVKICGIHDQATGCRG